MLWRQAHQQAMIAAAEAHEEARVDSFSRIDVFEAVSELGMKLTFRPLAGCAALYLPSVLGSRPGAVVHVGHPLALQRFSAAHELGHHVFGHGAQVVREGEPRPRQASPPPEEMLAEAFAAWFLMPPEAAEVALERLGLDAVRFPDDAYALSLRLGTSFKATCIHLESLKQLKRQVATEWSQRALKPVKEAMTTIPPPGGWRNDLWLVRPEEAEPAPPLTVRAGDRLLFTLPAGWELDELPPGASASVDPSADLLDLGGHPRRSVDLPCRTAPGPAAIAFSTSREQLRFRLRVERPREGLYVPAARAAR
jgi:hypothetical protein